MKAYFVCVVGATDHACEHYECVPLSRYTTSLKKAQEYLAGIKSKGREHWQDLGDVYVPDGAEPYIDSIDVDDDED